MIKPRHVRELGALHVKAQTLPVSVRWGLYVLAGAGAYWWWSRWR